MDFRLQEASLAFISLGLEEGGVEKTMVIFGDEGGRDIEIWLVTSIAQISKVLVLFKAI